MTDPLASLPSLSARDVVRGDGVADAVHEIARRGGRYLITRYGKPVAALVSVADIEVLQRLDGWSWADLDLLKKTCARGEEPAREDNDA